MNVGIFFTSRLLIREMRLSPLSRIIFILLIQTGCLSSPDKERLPDGLFESIDVTGLGTDSGG
jgi:hypothetical protein